MTPARTTGNWIRGISGSSTQSLHTLKDCEKTNKDRTVIPKVPKTLGKFFENFEKNFWVARQISQFLTFRMFVLAFRAEVLGLDNGGLWRIRDFLLNFLLLLELRFYLRSFSVTPQDRGGMLEAYISL